MKLHRGPRTTPGTSAVATNDLAALIGAAFELKAERDLARAQLEAAQAELEDLKEALRTPMTDDPTWARIPHDRDEWKRTVRDRWKDWLENQPTNTVICGNESAYWVADDSLQIRMWRSGSHLVSTIVLTKLHTEFNYIGWWDDGIVVDLKANPTMGGDR